MLFSLVEMRMKIFPMEDKGGRKSDSIDPEDVDQTQLSRGTAHEKEHTEDPKQAQRIALDHLSQDPAYYKKLEKFVENESVQMKLSEFFMTEVPMMVESRKDGTPKGNVLKGKIHQKTLMIEPSQGGAAKPFSNAQELKGFLARHNASGIDFDGTILSGEEVEKMLAMEGKMAGLGTMRVSEMLSFFRK